MSETKKLCVGCTIGPIFNTLNKAKYIPEIWMASFLFSHIAKLTVDYLTNNNATMISPTKAGCETARNVSGVGLYSDHIFFEMAGENKQAALDLVEKARNSALLEIAKDIYDALQQKYTQDAIHSYLLNAIFILPVVHCIESGISMPISKITDELDLLECYPPYVDRSNNDTPDFLEEYLVACQSSSLFKSQIPDQDIFLSITDTPTASDIEKLEDYVAMVQADGDNMGKLLATLSSLGEIALNQKVSEFLFKQGKSNKEVVADYGAVPVYFGGDDMFFIASLLSKDGKQNIFDLLQALQKNFEDAFENLVKTEEGFSTLKLFDTAKNEKALSKPALSFGVSICHKDLPLLLMREATSDALFIHAKNTQWTRNRSKKAMHFILRKHSGQQSALSIESHEAYDRFTKLIRGNVDKVSLHALHWKIHEQKAIITYLLTLNPAQRQERLKQWLKQNFNETSPEDAELTPILSLLNALASDLWDESEIGNNADKGQKKRSEAQERIFTAIDGAFRLYEFMVRDERKEKKQS